MKLSKKIKDFQNILLDWFEGNGRSFQWRKLPLSDYEIIIAEVLLQRTKAETVSRFYDNFLQHFPNWHSLASSKLDELEIFLVPIGLYKQRANRLHNLAVYMDSKNGILTKDRKELERVPFMGQYIANGKRKCFKRGIDEN